MISDRSYHFKQILEAGPHKTAIAWSLTPISQTIQESQARHTGHCSRSKDKFISNVLQWIPICEHTNVGLSAIAYIHQLWVNTGCCWDDLPVVTNGERERERFKGIHLLVCLDDDDDDDDDDEE